MSSNNENPPPSYSEATSQARSGSPRDEAHPEGWVEGYVEPARTNSQAPADYHPPAPSADEKTSSPSSTSDSSADTADTRDQEAKPKSSGLSFGGMYFGSKVLGFGYGDNVSGAGIKIGSLLLGMVDTEQAKPAPKPVMD